MARLRLDDRSQWRYWIADHSIADCIFCPKRIPPVIKCCVIRRIEGMEAEVVDVANSCTAFVPVNKLFKTPNEAWEDYNLQQQKE